MADQTQAVSAATPETTLEWFGATTFRLTIGPLVFFLDTWLDRPSNVPQYLSTADVKKCDYILISHAVSASIGECATVVRTLTDQFTQHFDHLPGADIIAKNTGAKVRAALHYTFDIMWIDIASLFRVADYR